MNITEIDQLINEINTDGSHLHQSYVKWKNNRMTKLVGSILYALSTPDKAAGKLVNVPGTGEDSACAVLGYVLGRSHATSEMMQLDQLVETVG